MGSGCHRNLTQGNSDYQDKYPKKGIETCECRGKPKAVPMNNLVKRSQSIHLRKRSLLPISRPVTAEIEMSSCRDWDGYHFTHINGNFVRDGSIIGPHPIEMILGPFTTQSWKNGIAELSRFLRDYRAEANESCGLHVHVDGKDLGGFELRRLLNIYRVIEPLFYSAVSEDRAISRHSRPITGEEWEWLLRCNNETENGRIRHAILLGNYLPVLPDEHHPIPLACHRVDKSLPWADAAICKLRAASKYDISRYRGLNLHTFFHRGTIEFRHHEGTVDASRIDLWMQWCRWTVELASQLTDREVAEIRVPDDFLLGVWKRPSSLLRIPEQVVEMIRGGRIPRVHPEPIAPPRVPADQVIFVQEHEVNQANLDAGRIRYNAALRRWVRVANV